MDKKLSYLHSQERKITACACSVGVRFKKAYILVNNIFLYTLILCLLNALYVSFSLLVPIYKASNLNSMLLNELNCLNLIVIFVTDVIVFGELNKTKYFMVYYDMSLQTILFP